jgi:hypothetical protein
MTARRATPAEPQQGGPMDPLPATVIRPTGSPVICAQDDGTWLLEFVDEGVAAVLTTPQVRKIVDDFLEQSLGGPFDTDDAPADA